MSYVCNVAVIFLQQYMVKTIIVLLVTYFMPVILYVVYMPLHVPFIQVKYVTCMYNCEGAYLVMKSIVN